MQPDGVDLWYFKLRIYDLPELIVWNIKGLGKVIGIRKSEFVAKAQFLRKENWYNYETNKNTCNLRYGIFKKKFIQ